MGPLIVLISMAQAACPDLAESLDAATQNLVEGADAKAQLTEAETRLACTELSPALLSRLWLVHGAARLLAGDKSGAEPFFAAAAVLAPAGFDERLGPDVKSAWEAAKLEGPGRLVVDKPVRIDGAKVRRFPHLTDSGPHALQSLELDWAQVVVVPPNEELTVTTPLSVASPSATTTKKSPAFLIVGAASLAGAGGLAYGAIAQTPVMEQAGSINALDESYGLQQGFAWSAVGLAAVAVTSTTLHFVF